MPANDYADQQRIIDEVRAKQLFFVCGLPKSGSTWLQIQLHAHPEVSCAGEGHFLTYLAPRLAEALNKYNAYVKYKSHVVLEDLVSFPTLDEAGFRFLFASAVLLQLAASGKAREVRVVGDKTPDNLEHLAHLATLFPTAKFIHALRDPRDCTISAWFHNLRLEAKGAKPKFATLAAFVPFVARNWVEAIGRWERVAAAVPARCTVVRYEDLVARPQVELARLFAYLGVGTDAAAIAACIAAGDFARLTGGRAAGVEDRGSLLRRGLPGDWRNHFTSADEASCREIAAGVMARYGYTA